MAPGTSRANVLAMLPPYIIEELRERERVRREESTRPQPQVELPMPPPPKRESPRPDSDRGDRGVIIIDVF